MKPQNQKQIKIAQDSSHGGQSQGYTAAKTSTVTSARTKVEGPSKSAKNAPVKAVKKAPVNASKKPKSIRPPVNKAKK